MVSSSGPELLAFVFNFSKNSRMFNQKYISTPEDLFESDLDFHSEVITGY